MKFHWEEVEKIAKAHHLESPTDSPEAFERFLIFWWCEKFNRPLKDPLLKQYTVDELWYEFLRYFFRIPDNDPKAKLAKDSKEQEELDWVKAQLEKIKDQIPSPKPIEPSEAFNLPEISTKFEQ